ncbi:MAG: type II CRISPR RNA-guided endonuclease Cas9 [Lachnospiraceae bacterium]|nr:type II CRISPR RNA-guided endonuclease Cas9 [Lachnospiraceae bacterium]
MSKKNAEDYYLGLDVGTESIGWAVTDMEYHVLKFNQKNMWGVRLFEGAKTAAERRGFRCARRRLARRKERLELLEELLAEEICKLDENFFLRLKESKYYPEDKDKRLGGKQDTLFADTAYSDKQYHEEYPTIYHLRKALIDGEKSYDLRLYFLAIHHILKHRGHFLFEGSLQSATDFDTVYGELRDLLQDEYGISFVCQNVEKVKNVLQERSLGVTRKKAVLNTEFNTETKPEKEIVVLLAGGKANLATIFEDSALGESEISKLSFLDGKYDENIVAVEEQFPEYAYAIEKMKAIYDWGILADILGEEKYLSYSKVKLYEKHGKDLRLLKEVIRELDCFSEQDYKNIFTVLDKSLKNYAAYVGKTLSGHKRKPGEKNYVTQEELCSFLLKHMEKVPEDIVDERVEQIKKELQEKTFLPKQTSKDNGVIPYQLHLVELEKILDTMEKDYPFILEKDGEGWSVKDKILKLMKFRIPYYVGPLNDAHRKEDDTKGTCWIVKKDIQKIYPWNFDKIVDVDATAERFIRRMTNKCTYLVGEDVLPKNSLLYSEYMVLNELNNLKINNEKPSIELKEWIYHEVFKKQGIKGKVTLKKLKNYLKQEGKVSEADELSGLDGEFQSSLNSYHDMKEILGSKVDTNPAMAEDIILSIVLFGEDKKILERRLEARYVKAGKLSKEEVAKILKKRYAGWGRMSRKFLNGIEGTSRETGECGTIIHLMKKTNDNLMQLLSTKYTFLEEMQSFNDERNDDRGTFTYDMVDELYVSPSVKRMIWQTLRIVKEITHIMGHSPKKVFVEMAREKSNSGRTTSRKNQLLQLYANIQDESREWKKELENTPESKFRSIKLYLYYTQMGKCMYSGESIDLEQLANTNIYDRDHIYPQSKTKDDSLDNLVLVKKDMNAKKSDQMLSAEIQSERASYWRLLRDRGLISKEKYERLTRRTPLSEEELAGFINRQLVETRQSTKAIADVLGRVMKDSEVVYVKAGHVSQFRQENELVKVREVNDYHHAQDAYLNIVVGNVYNTKFTKSPVNFLRDKNHPDYNLAKMYTKDIERGGVTAWRTGTDGTIKVVMEMLKMNLSRKGAIQFTRFAHTVKGGFFDQQLMKKGKGQVPVKGSDNRLSIEKYGGYNKAAGAYFSLVESRGKKGLIRTLEAVPVYLVKQYESNEGVRKKYLEETCKLVEPRIVIPKIKIDSLLVLDGYPVHLSGRTGKQIVFKNAVQLVLLEEEVRYLKRIIKYLARSLERSDKRKPLAITEYDGITPEGNIAIYDKLLDKHKNTLYSKRASGQIETLEKGRDTFGALSVEQQCITIGEMLDLFQCKQVSSDLSLIGGAGKAGVFQKSNTISKNETAYLILQSPTGLFEKKIDLLQG